MTIERIGIVLFVLIVAFFGVNALIAWQIARGVQPYLDGAASAKAAGMWLAQDEVFLDQVRSLAELSERSQLVRDRITDWPLREDDRPLDVDGVQQYDDGLGVLVRSAGRDGLLGTMTSGWKLCC